MFWKEDNPKITFRYREDFEWLDKPRPAGKMLPEWFKKLPRVPEGEHKNHAGTVKRCVPVLDACTNGYIIPAWCDIHVIVKDEEQEDGTKEPAVWVSTPTSMGMDNSIGTHSWEQVGNDCPLKNYPVGKVLLKLNNPWVIETSPGWSVMFKSPPNHYNNIRLIEGVVDTDTYKRQVNFPFFWDGCVQGEFEIKKGDPLVHVIPFKRQKVEMEFDSWDHEYMTKMDRIHDTVWFDKYKKLWWHKRK